LPDERNRIVAAKRHVRVNPEERSLSISGRRARVGGWSDLRHAFPKDALDSAFTSNTRPSEGDLRAAMGRPLLVVYLIKGFEAVPGGEERIYRDGLTLPALGLHFPGRRDGDTERNFIRYRLNRVAQRQLFSADEDDVELPDDEDD